MSSEFPLEDNNKKTERLNREISMLEDRLEVAKAKLEYHDMRMKEYNEIRIIIDGLNKKLDVLVEEDRNLSKEVPNTEVEWEAFYARMERISKIRDALTKLYDESEVLMEDLRKKLAL